MQESEQRSKCLRFRAVAAIVAAEMVNGGWRVKMRRRRLVSRRRGRGQRHGVRKLEPTPQMIFAPGLATQVELARASIHVRALQ